MNVYRIVNNSKIYGPNDRNVIWFKGCTLGCKNCINKFLWKKDSGSELSINEIKSKLIGKEITLLGGEPLEQKDILTFVRTLKNDDFGIILFTGYEYEELNCNQKQAADACDVVIYGRYKEELKDDSLYLRGSRNQKIVFNSKRYDKKLFKERNEFEICIGKNLESRGRSKNFLNELFDIK